MFDAFVRRFERRFALSDADKAALKHASAHVIRVDARTNILPQGSASDHLHLIQSGIACRSKVLPGRSRTILAYLIPGDICDLHASILGAMDHSVDTLTACHVMRVPRTAMSKFAVHHPTLDAGLHWMGLVDEAIGQEWLFRIGSCSAEKQIAHLFCELLVRFQSIGLASENSYLLPLRQLDISETVGISPVHVNRVLQKLRGEKLVVLREKRIFIPNVDKLKSFADFSEEYLHLSQITDQITFAMRRQELS